MRVGLRQYLERPGLQGVASQNGCGFIKTLVCRGLATPQVVVVHRRQVVMHQGVGVQHLDRCGHPRGTGLGHGEYCRALHHQEGPEPLAATQCRVAHRISQPGFGTLRQRQQALQRGLHDLGDLQKGGGEIGVDQCH